MIKRLTLLLLSWQATALAVVTVSPSTAPLATSATYQFTASGGTAPYTFTLRAGSTGTITSGGLYTAPNVITVNQFDGGCAIFPADHIYNTRVDSLPVRSDSDLLMGSLPSVGLGLSPSFGTNVLTNTTGTFNASFLYTSANNGLYQIADWPGLQRESGVFSPAFSNQDRHVIAINRDTCQLSDIYNNYNLGENPDCPTCTAQSGVKYNSWDLNLSTTGATDAAGMAQQPVALRLDDIRSGQVKHALRFTLTNNLITPDYIWPATANAVPYCAGPSCFKYGTYVRLRSTTTISGYSPTAQIILNGLKQYGMIMTDGGTTMDVQTNTDVMLDSATRAALIEIFNGQIQPNNFQVISTTGVYLSSTTGAINLSNSYVTPAQFAEIIATDSLGSSSTVRVPLRGIAIGVPDKYISIYAGQSVTLGSWVTGSTNTTVTWGMSPSTGSLVGNLFTAPSALTRPTRTRLTATSVANPLVAAYVDVVVMPDNDSGAVRLDVGSFSDTTDSGHTYWNDTWSVFESGLNAGIANDTIGWAGGTPVYQYTARQYYADPVYKFFLPNGNYKITASMALGNSSGPLPAGSNTCHQESQAQLVRRNFSLNTATGGYYLTPGSVTLPMQVTNGSGYFAQRHLDATRGLCILTALSVVPDTGTPHLEIDDAGVTGNMSVGQTRQLYSVGWYMSSTATWSVLSGSGVVSSTGLYTAPSSPPGSSVPTTVRATSGSRTADYSFNLVFGSMTVTPSSGTISRSQTQQFTASIGGIVYTNVSWSISPSTVGAISGAGLYTAPSTVYSTTTVTVTATSLDDPTKSSSTAITVVNRYPAQFINCGGTLGFQSYTDSAGNLWSLDTGYDSGQTDSGVSSIAGVPSGQLVTYQAMRYRYQNETFNYAFNVPNGTYRVTLKFAEYRSVAQNSIMDVLIEGVTVLDDFNYVTAAGGVQIANDQAFNTTVSDGQLNISFQGGNTGGSSYGAGVNGIVIQDTSADPVIVSTVQKGKFSGGLRMRGSMSIK